MDHFDTVESIKQGQKFFYNGEQYMKLPEHVTCYGEDANAVNMKTGTMIHLNEDRWIDLINMTVCD